MGEKKSRGGSFVRVCVRVWMCEHRKTKLKNLRNSSCGGFTEVNKACYWARGKGGETWGADFLFYLVFVFRCRSFLVFVLLVTIFRFSPFLSFTLPLFLFCFFFSISLFVLLITSSSLLLLSPSTL